MKKLLSIVILLGTINFLIGQNLPVNFENGLVSTSTFIDFDGGTATVLTNPNPSGINSSNKVAKIVRNGGATWSGSKIILSSNLDFSMKNIIRMKVYTTAPVGTIIKFKSLFPKRKMEIISGWKRSPRKRTSFSILTRLKF